MSDTENVQPVEYANVASSSGFKKSLGIKIIAIAELVYLVFNIFTHFSSFFNQDLFFVIIYLVILVAALFVLFSKNKRIYKISSNIVVLGFGMYLIFLFATYAVLHSIVL